MRGPPSPPSSVGLVKYAKTTASVTSVMRLRMPLHASTTSSRFVVVEPSGRSSITFPSRSTGMSNRRITHTAQRDASESRATGPEYVAGDERDEEAVRVVLVLPPEAPQAREHAPVGERDRRGDEQWLPDSSG